MKASRSRKRKKMQPKTARDSHVLVAMVEVDNPFFSRDHAAEAEGNLRRIVVPMNVRESAIGTMAARKQLDAAQVAAADRFRLLWEAMAGGSRAIDYSAEHVDGGGAVDPISERQVSAGLELSRCRELLGARGFDLIVRVCGEGLALVEVSSARRGRDTAADNLRDHLDDLAGMWGLAGGGRAGQSHASKITAWAAPDGKPPMTTRKPSTTSEHR